MSDNKLLTPEDVANLLGITREVVIRYHQLGKLPSIKIGRAVRFRPESIRQWLADQEKAA